MKNLSILLLLFSLSVLIVSCEEPEPEPAAPTFEFLNQTVQGSIEGNPWVYADGLAEDSQGGLSIQLSSTEYADPCNEFAINTQIRFFIYEKGEGTFDMDDDGFANFIGIGFVTGAIEVSSISGSSVSGKVDVEYTDDVSGVTSEINGNFTVPFCPN